MFRAGQSDSEESPVWRLLMYINRSTLYLSRERCTIQPITLSEVTDLQSHLEQGNAIVLALISSA
jgi:hypothetical protein